VYLIGRSKPVSEAKEMYDKAKKIYEDKNYVDAMRYLNKVIELQKASAISDEDLADVYFMKGYCYYEVEQFYEAITCFNELIYGKCNDTQLLRAINHKGLCLMDLKKYEDSIKCFDEVMEKVNGSKASGAPKFGTTKPQVYFYAFNNKVMSQVGSNKLMPALFTVNGLVAELENSNFPKDYEKTYAYDTAALVMYKNGYYKKSLELLGKAQEDQNQRKKDDADVCYHYGLVYYKLKKLGKSERPISCPIVISTLIGVIICSALVL